MRNKLVFPNGGTETKYAWDRYSLTREGQHIWDKCNVNQETFYYWDKCEIVKGQENYVWQKYEAIPNTRTWEKYPVITLSSDNNYNNNKDFIWYKYKYSEVKKYIRVKSTTKPATVNDTQEYTFNSGYLHFRYMGEQITSDGNISLSINWATIPVQQIIENNVQIKSLQAFKIFEWCWYQNPNDTIGEDRLVISKDQSLNVINNQVKISGSPFSTTGNISGVYSNRATLYDIEITALELSGVYDIVNSKSINAYPINDFDDQGYYYKLMNDGIFYYNNFLGLSSVSGCQKFSFWYHTGNNVNKKILPIIDYMADPKTLTANTLSGYPIGFDNLNASNFYKYIGAIGDENVDYLKGDFIEEVFDINENAYPKDDYYEGYFYKYDRFEDGYGKGDFIEKVSSSDKNAFPENNRFEGYWYAFDSGKIIYSKGEKIDWDNSFDKNKYPVDGKLGDYWYVYVGYENNGPYKNYFIDQIETNQPTSYPTNGIDGNYWYVYNKSYTGYKAQIFDNQIIGGINYQHNINPQSDATIGNVGMAKVDFTYDNTNDDFQQYIDLDYFLYYTWQKNDSDWRLIGKFFIDDVSYNRTRAKITAYDSICKAEKFVDDFIKQTTFPITLQAFYNNLLTYLGLENGGFKSLNMPDFSNLKQQIKDNFQAINITGRQILQYIAEMAGGYCLADKNGKIIIGDYSGKNTYPLNSSKYKKYEASKFEPERVRYVCAKMNTDDLGVAVGNADLGEEYIIENNPLFYTENENEIKPALTNLMNLLYRFTGGYKPGTIELLEDFGIEVGDRVVIGNNYFYVMSKTMSASGCKLECFGNKHREKQAQSINSEIVALRGKTNELVRDLEKTQSTLTDTANGLQSQITQTASQIRSEVKNNYDGLSSSITQTASQIRSEVNDTKNELSSTIEQTASSITATVSNNKQELESKIEQTASSISSTVSQQGQVISQIKQDLDGISLTYNSEEGTASITIGNITISQLVDGKYVDRVVAGIDFSGYCRFSDLSTPGQTIICGDNITTGTISADRINLTGSISWGDLSSSCKDTIASYAGADGSDAQVPSYIHNTYIDATTIKSPTIYGAKIYAGTNAEGYIKLASTGMNFYSNTGGSVCGIGYYPGKYNLPYIMLGQGVDDAGTDKGMIKKYTNGIWIGDSDNMSSDSPGGTGIFINFTSGKIQKYINGSVSTL